MRLNSMSNTCIYHFEQLVGFCPHCKLHVCLNCLSEHLDHLPSIITFKNLMGKLEEFSTHIEALSRTLDNHIDATRARIKACRIEVGQAFDKLEASLLADIDAATRSSKGRRHKDNVFALRRNEVTSIEFQELERLNDLSTAKRQADALRDYETEIQQLNSLLSRYHLQLDRISNMIQLNSVGTSDYEKADELYKKGKYTEALLSYNAAMEEMVRKVGVPENTHRSFQNHLSTCERLNDINSLTKMYEGMCILDPHNPDHHHELGNLYIRNNMNVEALQCFHNAARCQATTPSILVDQANCYLNLGMKDKALKQYEQATRLDPEQPEYYHNQGLIYKSMGDSKNAEVCFNKAKMLGRTQESRNTHVEAESYEVSHRYDLALEAYQRILISSPTDASIHARKGYCEYMLKNYEQSVKSYQQALNLSPNNSEYYKGMMKAYKELGEQSVISRHSHKTVRIVEEVPISITSQRSVLGQQNLPQATDKPTTIQDFDVILTHNPNDAEAWFHKGVLLQQVNRIEESLGCYQRACQLDSNEPMYLQAKKNLQLAIKKRQRKCF